MDNIELQGRIRRLILDAAAKGGHLVVQYGNGESDKVRPDSVQVLGGYLTALRPDGVTLEIPYAIITGVKIEQRVEAKRPPAASVTSRRRRQPARRRKTG